MRRKRLFSLPIFCLLLWAAAAGAEMRPVQKSRPGAPPPDVLAHILRSNRQALESSANQAPGGSGAAAPFLTWLADCGPEVRANFITGGTGGAIHTVRTLGNQLTGGLAAVDFGIRHLHTPVFLISGNTGNEAIRLFMEGYGHLEPEIRRELDHLHLPLAAALPAPMNGKEFGEQLLANIERNVDYQVEQAVARYADRVADGRLVVIGSLLDLDNAYGRGPGRLLIININGETDEARLLALPILAKIDPQLRTAAIGRKRPAKAEEAR